MADEIIFVMHRRVVVRPAAVTATKGYGFPDNPVRFRNATVPFAIVGELTDEQARESVAKRAGDTDAQVEQVKMQAAVEARVKELRALAASKMPADVARRVERLRLEADIDREIALRLRS